MAERKKRRRKSKQNVIDKTVAKASDVLGKGKAQVAGSKTVQAATESGRRALDTATGISKNIGTRAKEAVVPGAKEAAQKAKTVAAEKITLKKGGAAAANLRAKAREAGPQPERTFKTAATGSGGPTTPPPTETAGQRRDTMADLERSNRGVQEPAKKPGIKQRAINRTLRTGGPLAAGALIEPAIGFAADVSEQGGAAATEGAVEELGRTLRDAPRAAGEFARGAINDPLGTAGDVAIGLGDTAFNTGTAIGDAARALIQPGGFGANFRQNQEATQAVLNDPFSRFFAGAGGATAQPVGENVQGAVSQAPVVNPGETAPATDQKRTTGLRGAQTNREFLADKAKGFRTGFDVLQDAGVQRTGGIGDLAAYNMATRVARNANQAERAGREMNIAEAEARSDIEGQGLTNALNISKIDKNRAATDDKFRTNVIEAGEKSRTILEKHAALQQASSGTFGRTDGDIKALKDFQDVTINQALQSNFDPQMPDSIAASQMMTDAITPAMDRGVLQGVVDAMASSGFSAADILNDNGDLAVNRETIDLMSATQDTDGNIIIGMEVPTQDSQGNVVMDVRPLFPADDIEDPNMRDHMLRLVTKTSGQARTLQNAQR